MTAVDLQPGPRAVLLMLLQLATRIHSAPLQALLDNTIMGLATTPGITADGLVMAHGVKLTDFRVVILLTGMAQAVVLDIRDNRHQEICKPLEQFLGLVEKHIRTLLVVQ